MLRKSLREAGVEYKVYKNTLVTLAANELGLGDLVQYLEGPVSIAFGYEDATAPARVLHNFGKDHKKLELKAGTIDAFFCTAGAQTTAIGELAKKCDIRLLNIDEKSADKLKRTYKFYTDCTIPKETYQGQTEDIQTVGVKAVLLASDKLSADTVKDITKILFKNKEELQYSLPVDISIDEKTAVEGVTIPFHEGAAAYYEECGINIAD